MTKCNVRSARSRRDGRPAGAVHRNGAVDASIREVVGRWEEAELLATDERASRNERSRYDLYGCRGQLRLVKFVLTRFAEQISGNISAAASSNGMEHKIAGRLGDACIVGSGLYVDDYVGAAVASGDGDVMMRFCPTSAISYTSFYSASLADTLQWSCCGMANLQPRLRKKRYDEYASTIRTFKALLLP